MNKAFKFRMYPSSEQRTILAKTFGCTRMVYNHYLDKRIKLYQEENITYGYTQCANDMVTLKQDKTFLKEVDSVALQQSLKHLETAFQNFFRNKKFGFPKFKSKKNHKFSYTTVISHNNIRLENGYIKLPKVGKVKIKQHRTVPANYKLKSATVSQNGEGKYYISVLFEYEETIAPVVVTDKDKVLGLDYSTPKLYVDSNGNSPTEKLKYYKLSAEKLAKEQRKLSKKVVGSKNWLKQKHKVNKVHCKIANQRNDSLHKISTAITKQYDAIVIEDISIKEQLQNRKYKNFRKSTFDNGWYNFTVMLDYKLKDKGKKLIKLDKTYPSSQICSSCGNINPAVKDDSIRKWLCPVCGTFHHRDENAAINIKNEGLKILGIA